MFLEYDFHILDFKWCFNNHRFTQAFVLPKDDWNSSVYVLKHLKISWLSCQVLLYFGYSANLHIKMDADN